MCASQWVLNKPGGEMKVQAGGGRPHSGSPFPRGRGARRPAAFHLWKWRSLSAHVWDPKDGELCPDRTRPEETLVEVRSGSDVQIDRQIWV
ncbi:hypothetical protein JTE90_001686 [Oedothorax gibbosus]|uniref:Uncharacterized protein n=1 Tax=Oedothorax gibbosus TaxID=931172 RepID=A0AAV6TF27_9ARAC|nr:hypothetical protein JTE90_001686 [Oedothorax gibbosus]